SASRTGNFISETYPAINRWAISGRPLCGLPSALSKSFPEPDFKTVVIISVTQITLRPLFVLGDKRQAIRDSILDGQDVIRIRSEIGRISNRDVLADSLPDGQAGGRRGSGAANHRTNLQPAQAEQFVGRPRHRCVNQRISQQTGRRAET